MVQYIFIDMAANKENINPIISMPTN